MSKLNGGALNNYNGISNIDFHSCINASYHFIFKIFFSPTDDDDICLRERRRAMKEKTHADEIETIS